MTRECPVRGATCVGGCSECSAGYDAHHAVVGLQMVLGDLSLRPEGLPHLLVSRQRVRAELARAVQLIGKVFERLDAIDEQHPPIEVESKPVPVVTLVVPAAPPEDARS